MDGITTAADFQIEMYCECCFKMGRRFRKTARRFKALGQIEMAAKMDAEAVIQLDAWRKARQKFSMNVREESCTRA